MSREIESPHRVAVGGQRFRLGVSAHDVAYLGSLSKAVHEKSLLHERNAQVLAGHGLGETQVYRDTMDLSLHYLDWSVDLAVAEVRRA